MLWIAGRGGDPHVDALKAAADERAIPCRILGPDTGEILDFALGKSNSVPLVIWRLKRYSDQYIRTLAEAIDQFSELEWREAARGACEVSGACVLNGPDAIARAGCKPLQLKLARELDLRVPVHIVSNDISALLEFADAGPSRRIIKKPLASTHIPNVDALNETRFLSPAFIDREDLERAGSESIRACPVFLQEYVDKLFELRVIIVGEICFAFKIDSQASETTMLDWRRDIFRDMYSLHSVTVETESRLREFLRSLGLFSGVFDLIVDPDGTEVFLECNPNGQWLWLDHLVPGRIQRAFIDQALKSWRGAVQ
jgi:glutathione synthase/RimK-type ligase-like ATP-grasp enzyme